MGRKQIMASSESQQPSNDDVLAAVKKIFSHPATKAVLESNVIKRMLELDAWAKEKGLDSDARADLVKAVSTFLSSSSDLDLAREYATKVVQIVAEIGPALVNTLGAGVGNHEIPDPREKKE
jgi:hypothetical protein